MTPISEPAAAGTPFDLIGGEEPLRRLVDRFYDLLELEPAYAGVRQLHPQDMAGSRDKLFWFLCGWMGGPSHYTDRFGHPMLRARHLPFSIGIAERDGWMACMTQAMAETGIAPALAKRLLGSLAGTADWMRNRGTPS